MELNLELPCLDNYLESDEDVAIDLLNALFYRVTYNMPSTSLVYWLDKFSNHKQGNRMILALADAGVIKTTIDYNYAEIEMSKEWLLTNYTQQELDELILSNKLNKYLPLQTAKKITSNQAKLESGIKPNGITRPGFAKASTHKFKYDTEMMKVYRDEIVQFSIKAMVKMEEKLERSLRIPEGHDYGSIIEKAIDLIIANKDEEYILGQMIMDSRGRAIYEALKTIFNPISNKMARALVVAPKQRVLAKDIDNAYLFIAELYHGFNPDIPAKILQGKECYANRSLLDLDTTTEHGLDDLFENIWLERLYNELDSLNSNRLHQVTTPLEVDFSSSNMVIIGLLLGYNSYVDASHYMWQVEGLTKQHVKFAQTPYVFGSQASIKSLWTKNGLTFTAKQVDLMKYEQNQGKFTVANEFKDIIINHCNPTAVMQLHVGDEKFTVECNRHTNVGDTTKSYVVLDTSTNKFKLIQHTNTHKVPNLKQFRRYPVTGLIHNKDSQVLDNISNKMKWIIPIHDAGIVTWAGATEMREYAVEEMENTYASRQEIVYNYLKSINLDQSGMVKYAKLLAKIAVLNGDTAMNISPYLLK